MEKNMKPKIPRGILFSFALLASAPAWTADAPPKLGEQLLSSNRETRLKAIDDFNKLPSEAKYRLVPDMMVGLTDEDPEVRARAAKMLKVLGVTPDGKPPDARQLKSETATDKGLDPEAARKEIQNDKDQGFPDLKHELDQEKKSQGGMDAADLKSDHDVTGGPSPILEALKDPDPTMRARAARHVGAMRPPPVDAVPILAQMLTDKDTEVRASAAGALGSIGPAAQSAIPSLTRALADADPGVRQIVGDALKQINSPQ
jgi:hypothetical protein